MYGVEQHSPCCLPQIPYPLFGYAVLPVGVYAAECDGLSLILAVLYERVVCKPTVVGVVLFDRHTMIPAVCFECPFRCQCILRGKSALEMHILIPRGMIHEDCRVLEAPLGKYSLQLCYEALIT